MRRLLSCLMLGAILVSANAATPEEEIREKVPAAMAILKKWEDEAPEKAERKLHLVYWSPKDRKPALEYRERLTRILEDIQDFYAREMQRLGFGPRTIGLDYADDGLLRIHTVTGRKDYAAYDVQSGGEIRNECLPTLRAAGIDAGNETLVIFCNMSNWDADKATISQNSPYYAGGTHRGGNAWQVDSPILNLKGLTDTETKVRDGQYGHISLGRYNSIFIGGVCHELGHALGLPHNRERPDERKSFGTALMGSGNRTYGEDLRKEGKGSFLTLAHGLKLAAHPMFSGSIRGMNQGSNAKVEDLSVKKNDSGFVVRGKVTANPPAHAVIGYMDPAGGGDYNATTCTAVPDADGRFELHANALVPGEGQEFRIVVCQANGASSTYVGSNSPWEIPYNVDRSGKVDVSLFQTLRLLKPLADRVHSGDVAAAEAELKRLRDAEVDSAALEIAEVLVNTLTGKPGPSAVEGNRQSLADLKPTVSKVGWGRPVTNRTPDPSVLIQAGGQLFPRGIYAHAPARHQWDLGGKWTKLEGKAGLASTHGRGTCAFAILADGKEVWKSGKLTGNTLKSYSVDLTGVKTLELKVEDGGDGTGGDWGFWLDPWLSR